MIENESFTELEVEQGRAISWIREQSAGLILEAVAVAAPALKEEIIVSRSAGESEAAFMDRVEYALFRATFSPQEKK